MTTPLDLQELARLVGPQIAANAEANDAADRFPAGHYELLSRFGVFSALVPVELGGGGVRYGDMCAFLRELARHCPSTALSLSMHQHLVAAAVYHHRHGRPGRKLLERVSESQLVLISTGANDWLDSSGTLMRVEGGFRLWARKPFGSGSPQGDLLVTSAPFDAREEGWQVLHFAVPMHAPGVSLADDWRTLGMRATGSSTVNLEEVFVPDEAVSLRRPRGRFHPAWNVILTVALPLIMSVYAGVAETAAERGRELARARPAEPGAAELLGELANRLTGAQLAVDDMVRLAGDFDFEASVTLADAMLVRKTLAAEGVLATAEKALEAAGGRGFYRSAGLERLLRDAHAAQFHPLPAKRQQRFTGRLALGLDPVAD
ncbi:MAG: acyl-CoA dehydrogenase family protein [Steroidobacteraceae bacterium]